MIRKTFPRLLGAAAAVVLLVVALTAIAGTGLAAPTAAQANYAPTNSAAPTISGTPQVGQTLTANSGTWNSSTTPTFSYQWERCDTAGNNCAAIAGATGQTYTVQSAAAWSRSSDTPPSKSPPAHCHQSRSERRCRQWAIRVRAIW